MLTMRWVVTNSPSGQRSRSSTSTLPPPSITRRVAQGSGTQAPSISPDMKVSRLWPFDCGNDRHVAAALRGRLEALLEQPGAESHVLGIAKGGRGDLESGQIAQAR